MHRRIVLAFGSLLLAAMLSGCGASAGGIRADQSRLTAEEIASVDVATLYDVVSRLRPRWLEVRAPRGAFAGPETEIVVYIDRVYQGGPDELRRMGTETAAWIEYMDGAAASARLTGHGSRHVAGAIVVHTVER